MTELIGQHVLLAFLRRHIGAANGITATALVAEVNREAAALFGPQTERLSERGLRLAVKALREEGHHVCAHPRNGYFLAQTKEELLETTGFLKERAFASLRQVAAMERVSLQDLVGQMQLPT